MAGSLPGTADDFGDDVPAKPPTRSSTEWDASGDNYAHYGAAGLFFRYLALRSRRRRRAPRPRLRERQGHHRRQRLPPSARRLQTSTTCSPIGSSPTTPASPAGYLDSGDARASRRHDSRRPGTSGDGTVHQFAADYIEVDEPGTFAFDGAETVPLLADQPHSGSGQWWSARGDSIDTTLTREVDLTGVDSATLHFWTWFDIEKWYDYGYVEVSTDGGETWQVLPGRQTTEEDPVRQAYGPGYTGKSGGGDTPEWVEESIDLSAFAGQKVLLRFEYVTDGGLNTPGWAIDDVSIPEIGLSDDAESDGDWTVERLPAHHRPHRAALRRAGHRDRRPDAACARSNSTPRTTRRSSCAGPTRASTKSVVVIAAMSEATSEEAQYRYSFTTGPSGLSPVCPIYMIGGDDDLRRRRRPSVRGSPRAG